MQSVLAKRIPMKSFRRIFKLKIFEKSISGRSASTNSSLPQYQTKTAFVKRNTFENQKNQKRNENKKLI